MARRKSSVPRPNRRLIQEIRKMLREEADPGKAAPMQAYMKSEMPFLGVQTPVHRAACRRLFREHPLAEEREWQDTILSLFRHARYREERYCALNLAGFPPYRCFQTMKALLMYEEIVVTGAWWDYVDAIATQRLGELLENQPLSMGRMMRRWSRSGDIWKRRCSILCQLKSRQSTDLELLYDCIEPSMERAEFFLRKGIGWALREYAKTNRKEVVRFVRQNKARLSPLTKREALRNVIRDGHLARVP